MTKLTPREREVLALIAEGHSNAAICRTLWISEKTLDTHVARIYTKLELRPHHGHRRVLAALAWRGAVAA
jgi:DNA-binding CsgD family transcriptional regulator